MLSGNPNTNLFSNRLYGFLKNDHAYTVTVSWSFTITRSDNANHFFFGYWAQKHALCIFVVKVIMHRGST